MSEETVNQADLEHLILRAFAVAAGSGRAEWYRMRGSVLKNRLLDLTERSFAEKTYGADRFSDLVSSLDDLLEVDYSNTPFIVELREPHRSRVKPIGHVAGSASKGRIRPDLWHAVVDYSSESVWAWDRRSRRAVQVDDMDAVRSEGILPTVNRSTLQQWRAEFAQEHGGSLGSFEGSKLTEWAGKGLGTQDLPLRLRNSWNATIRQRVHDRLLDFFRERDENPPRDLIVERYARDTVDELRTFVMRCVALMTEQELKELSIPAGIAFRAHR